MTFTPSPIHLHRLDSNAETYTACLSTDSSIMTTRFPSAVTCPDCALAADLLSTLPLPKAPPHA